MCQRRTSVSILRLGLLIFDLASAHSGGSVWGIQVEVAEGVPVAEKCNEFRKLRSLQSGA